MRCGDISMRCNFYFSNGTSERYNSSNCAGSIGEGPSSITSRPALFFGKAIKSRIESTPPNNEQSRSKPNAKPPCGGAP